MHLMGNFIKLAFLCDIVMYPVHTFRFHILHTHTLLFLLPPMPGKQIHVVYTS